MMTNEEIKLQELAGKENPFRVPSGYFEHFDERLLARLPQPAEQPRKTIRLMPRLWRYAAAIVFVAGVGAAMLWNRNTAQPTATTAELAQEEYYNDALDYIMVGNMEIAEYLTEAD